MTDTRSFQQLLDARWSPYGFIPRPLDPADLAALFDAAAKAPSAFNAQPWRYVVGLRHEACFERILGCLLPMNQSWARHASALALGVVRESFEHNGAPNACAIHDLGAASAFLCLAATARGIAVHQMAGLDLQRARQEFAMPDDFRVFSAIAIGYPGAAPELPEALLARDAARRPRRGRAEFVFGGDWGTPAALPD